MKQDFQITYKDGRTERAVAGLAEFVALEETYGISVGSLENDARITYLAFLAWRASIRSGGTLATTGMDEWMTTVEELDPVDGTPTPASSPQPSSPSPSPELPVSDPPTS